MAVAMLPLLLLAAPQAPDSGDEDLSAIYGERWTPEARAYQTAGPSVVSIDVYRERVVPEALPNPGDLLSTFGPPVSQGTGVVIDQRGFVITNAHVVAADADVNVDFLHCRLSFASDFGGGAYWARVLNVDREWDLALLKIRGNGPFPAIPMADDDELLIGERVVAIGTAFGNSHSITAGILSGVHRDILVEDARGRPQKLRGALQTDAAINPGNSGGPLLNIHGELIGINSATLLAADGIGFAIPVSRVREILEARLFEPRVWLGLSFARGRSLVVERVHPRGPAHQAGLQAGDRIEAVDGTEVSDVTGFQQELVLRQPGERVQLDFVRDGRRRSVALPLPDIRVRDTYGLLGFEARRADIRVNDGFAVRSYPALRLERVYPNTGAARLGLQEGDRIVAVHLEGEAGARWEAVSSLSQLIALVRGPQFDHDGVNLWWIKPDGTSRRGRLTFDDPAMAENARGS